MNVKQQLSAFAQKIPFALATAFCLVFVGGEAASGTASVLASGDDGNSKVFVRLGPTNGKVIAEAASNQNLRAVDIVPAGVAGSKFHCFVRGVTRGEDRTWAHKSFKLAAHAENYTEVLNGVTSGRIVPIGLSHSEFHYLLLTKGEPGK